MSELRVEVFTGDLIKPYIPELAKLRMIIFREYPYLYEGDLEYETSYLKTYTSSPDSFVIVIFDGNKVVGAATGIPLSQEAEEFQRPFLQQGYDLDKIIYIGEVLLYPEYHGHIIGLGIIAECDKRAKQHGANLTVFCAVERPDNHPYKPPRYRQFDALWRLYGFKKHPELATTYAWKDVGDSTETRKPMIFWTRDVS